MIDDLVHVLAPVVAPFNVDLDEVNVTKAGKRRVLDIVLDSDSGIDLDTVAHVSRAISEYLDTHDVFDDLPYLLEVGSRGVARPLTKPQHWRRNIGRLVTFTHNGQQGTGRIKNVEGDMVRLTTETGDQDLNIQDVTQVLIQVEFNRASDDDSAEAQE